jgi:hypothetical protein
MVVDFSVYESSVQTAPVKGSRHAVIPKFVVLPNVGTEGCRQGATDFHPCASISEKGECPQRCAPKEKLNSSASSNLAATTPGRPDFPKAPGAFLLMNRSTTFSESVHYSKRFKRKQVVFVKAKQIGAVIRCARMQSKLMKATPPSVCRIPIRAAQSH